MRVDHRLPASSPWEGTEIRTGFGVDGWEKCPMTVQWTFIGQSEMHNRLKYGEPAGARTQDPRLKRAGEKHATSVGSSSG
jgi:hypothetical protein